MNPQKSAMYYLLMVCIERAMVYILIFLLLQFLMLII